MKILISLFLFATCVFADNNYGDLVYSKDTTINGYFYNEKGGKITINHGVKITYKNSVDNRDGAYYENNGEITMEHSGATFSNVLGGIFINNGSATFSNAFSNSSTATFYADAKAEIVQGNNIRRNGTFRNWKGGTFIIIGATLTGNFEVDDAYYARPPATLPTNTLIFGICDLHDLSKCGTKMGQINGNFTNKSKSSIVNVNIANMVYGQKYTIITGTISGLDSIGFVGANLGEVTTHYNIANGVVWIEKKSIKPDPSPDNPNPPPHQEPNAPRIKSNAEIIKNAIETTFANKVPAFDKTQGAVDLDSTLQKSFVAQPANMLKAFKNSTATMSLNTAYKSHFATKSTTKNSAKNPTNSTNSLAHSMQIFATPFATILQGNGLNGNLFGFVGGFAFLQNSYVLQTHFSYARGASNQRLFTQITRLNGDLIEIGGFARLFFIDRLELDFEADFLFGKFDIKNSWISDSTMNLNADFNNYQLNFGAIIGWRFGERFSIKPFVGVQTHFEAQDSFRQNNGLQIQSNAYNTLIWGALVGVESRYDFTNGIFIYAKAQYETFSAPKNVRFMLNGESLQYANKNYKHIINVNVGASFAVIQRLKIEVEGLYQRYNDGINYFGGNITLRWNF